MSNQNHLAMYKFSSIIELIVISFGLLLFTVTQISCKSEGAGKSQSYFSGTFYGYGEPSSSNVGGVSIDVGPSSYILEFDMNQREDNRVKLILQEWEITKEDGGSWSRPVIGTTITSDYYTDEYAKPIVLYGDYTVFENQDSINIAGEMNQGEYLKPVAFRIAFNKRDLTNLNNYYSVIDSTEVCFDLRLEVNKLIKYCSTKKYFVNQMISQYEKQYGKKMTTKSREKLMEMYDISN